MKSIWHLYLTIVHRVYWRVFHSRNWMLDIYWEIQELEEGDTCRDLGTGESGSKEHQQMKEKLKKGIHLEVKNDVHSASPKADIHRLKLRTKGGGSRLLWIEATCKAELTGVAEWLNTKCKEDQFVNVDKNTKTIDKIWIHKLK
jgi:hypothetical protein